MAVSFISYSLYQVYWYYSRNQNYSAFTIAIMKSMGLSIEHKSFCSVYVFAMVRAFVNLNLILVFRSGGDAHQVCVPDGDSESDCPSALHWLWGSQWWREHTQNCWGDTHFVTLSYLVRLLYSVNTGDYLFSFDYKFSFVAEWIPFSWILTLPRNSTCEIVREGKAIRRPDEKMKF